MCMAMSRVCKQGNTNTPVRQAANPVTSPGSDYTSTVKNDSPSCSNITFRASQQPLRHEAKLTLDNIRDVIKQEMMSIVKLKVTEELNVIKQHLSSCHDSITFMNAKFEELKACIEEKSSTISKLQSDNEILRTTVHSLSARLDIAERNLRESNIEINGLPEHRSENLINVVSQLAKTIGCPLPEHDICKVTRVAKLSKDNERPRTVIVKICNSRQRDIVLASVINFNKKNPKDKFNSHHLGLGGPRVPVYVAEHLTPNNKALHAAARKKSKEMNYKFNWVRSGRIYVRKDETSQAVLIRSYDSLKLVA
ncbi:unnamed protein product [Arctia plantaginis]|uniref:FP protein C-terminal domain-containing protein n=1 Tax=Arctia plantaginis TaxID=874455 RepID=A0A8S1APG4_ARCPL|nr:unnamed protein product [Arctia plantaginis]